MELESEEEGHWVLPSEYGHSIWSGYMASMKISLFQRNKMLSNVCHLCGFDTIGVSFSI